MFYFMHVAHQGFDYDLRKSLGRAGWKRCWNQTLHLCGLQFVLSSHSGTVREIDCYLTASPNVDGSPTNSAHDCVTDLFKPVNDSGMGQIQIEFVASSKGLRCALREQLVPNLQVNVGRSNRRTPEVVDTSDAGVPGLTFMRDLVCSYTGFDPSSTNTSVQSKESQLFEAKAVLAKYYHRPKRYRDNYVALIRRKLSASNLGDHIHDESMELQRMIKQQQRQTLMIGQAISTTLARRLAHQACWLPQWSCGRLVVSITRLAIARVIPKLLLSLQRMRPVERQLKDAVMPTWQLLRAAWSVGAGERIQRKNEQTASESPKPKC